MPEDFPWNHILFGASFSLLLLAVSFALIRFDGLWLPRLCLTIVLVSAQVFSARQHNKQREARWHKRQEELDRDQQEFEQWWNDVERQSLRHQARTEAILSPLGDPTCKYSANSSKLRCAVNPSGPCEGCPDRVVNQGVEQAPRTGVERND